MNNVSNKLKAPAIGLIINGVCCLGLGIITIMSGLVRLAGLMGPERRIADDAERLGFIIGTVAGYGSGVLSVLAGPIIIIGAARMIKGKNYGLAMTAAVLSVLPITCCFFPLGLIFGIWSLVVLRNAEIKAFFSGEYDRQFTPPQNWQQ